MKIKPSQIDRFLKAPDPAVILLLFYGPDRGLVQSRARRVLEEVAGDPDDPFRSTELEAEALARDPALLVDEARALSLTGSRRVIRIRDAGDAVARAVGLLLEVPDPAAMTVLEAGDLSPRSSLRRLVEAAKNAAALPCYRSEAAALGRSIEGFLRQQGLEASEDALAFLAAHLGADTGSTRMELEKLALYAASRGLRRIGREDAEAVVGDASAIGLDHLSEQVLRGRGPGLDPLMERLFAEGAHPVQLLRSLSLLLLRMLALRVRIEQGEPVETVLSSARPPLHFRTRRLFSQTLPRWDSRRLLDAVRALQEAELASKRTASPAELICRHLVLDLASGRRGDHM